MSIIQDNGMKHNDQVDAGCNASALQPLELLLHLFMHVSISNVFDVLEQVATVNKAILYSI